MGSVHHINDIPFDYSQKEYDRCADACGSLDNLYHAYLDLQYEMIQALKPFVVGHFDSCRSALEGLSLSPTSFAH